MVAENNALGGDFNNACKALCIPPSGAGFSGADGTLANARPATRRAGEGGQSGRCLAWRGLVQEEGGEQAGLSAEREGFPQTSRGMVCLLAVAVRSLFWNGSGT